MEKIEFNVWIECRDNLPIDSQVADSRPFDSAAVDQACEAFRERLIRASMKRRGYVMQGYGPDYNHKQGF